MRNCSLRVSSIILFLGLALGASAAQNQAAEKIETRVESKAIPPSVVYEISRTVGAGRTLKQDGKPGKVDRTYEVTFVDGKPKAKKLIKEERVEPTPTLILLGQKGFSPSRHKFGRGSVRVMNATAYDPSPQTIGRGATGRTRDGHRATYGVVAVDPRVIPLGTLLFIEGYGMALACDTGSAIKGNRIDLCYDSRHVANAYGRKNVVVHILK